MNANEIQRLAHAINALRHDWPISSLRTFIERSDLGKGSYRDAAVKLAWVAADTKPDGTPASETPKRVLEGGPWHRAALIEAPTAGRPHAPTAANQCRECGYVAGQCHPDCPGTRTRPAPPIDPSTRAAAIAAARAALRQGQVPDETQEETRRTPWPASRCAPPASSPAP